MASSDELILEGGRRVAVHLPAEGRGRTIAFCHAAPGAGNFDPDPEATAARQLTLLATDRPGYGGSEPVAADRWASVGSAADDLAAAIERRADGPVGVAGWSAGGRVALALAARHPELVDRVVVVATPAPDEEVGWIPPEYRAMLDAVRGQPPAVAHARLEEVLAATVPADPRAPEQLAQLGAGPADDRALALPGARERLGAMLEAAFAQGAAGVAADIAGYCLRPWGFEPSEVRAETLLLYGAKDPVATPEHGRWYRQRLPAARLEVVPDIGHLLVIPMWGRALSHLAPDSPR